MPLWTAADKLRGAMDSGEYKHVVLGLIFLKDISVTFEEYHHKLASEDFADPEDRDEYIAENIFWCRLMPAGTTSNPTLKIREESRSQDILGRVYEYFLGKFASSENSALSA